MIFQATQRYFQDGRLQTGATTLLAGRSMQQAAEACEYDWFDMVYVGPGMNPETYGQNTPPPKFGP